MRLLKHRHIAHNNPQSCRCGEPSHVDWRPPLCCTTGSRLVDLVRPGERDGGFGGLDAAARQRHDEIDRSVQLSCGEHTDYGMLTIVNQQLGVTALQVLLFEYSYLFAYEMPHVHSGKGM